MNFWSVFHDQIRFAALGCFLFDDFLRRRSGAQNRADIGPFAPGHCAGNSRP
jgi:hypothetical protein